MAHPQIVIFARLAGQDSKPTRVLAGQKTKLARTMHDIRYDAVNDEMFVGNPFASAILVFRGGADGEEAPIRIIQGPRTLLSSAGQVDRLDIDTIHNEIFVPLGNQVMVYPRDGNGDVAPIRVIRWTDAQWSRAGSIAVDPVHNMLALGASGGSAPADRANWGDINVPVPPRGGMVILNRTDNGDVTPRAVIRGPKTGIVRILQLRMYPPKGWIIATQPGRNDVEEPPGVYVGVWSIHDSGDVPARWKLGGPKSTLKKPRGVVLDPKHKELIIADMRLNSLLTYYFPEIF